MSIRDPAGLRDVVVVKKFHGQPPLRQAIKDDGEFTSAPVLLDRALMEGLRDAADPCAQLLDSTSYWKSQGSVLERVSSVLRCDMRYYPAYDDFLYPVVKFDGMEARMDALEADKSRTNALESEVQALKKELQEAKGKIAFLESELAAMTIKLSDQEEETKLKLSEYAAEVAELKMTAALTNEKQSRDAEKLRRLQTSLDRVLAGVSGLIRGLAAADDADAPAQP